MKWPRHFSNTAALVVMGLECAKSQVLVRKLGFLKKRMMRGGVGVGAAAGRAMMDDVESWYLVKECRDLEEGLGTTYTDEILMEPESVGIREMKKIVKKVCQEKLLLTCEDRAPWIAKLGRRKV